MNDPPTARNDAKRTVEDEALVLSIHDLMLNDDAGPPDESGQQLEVIAVAASAETHGTVSLASGVITYAPEADYFGEASFNYTIRDNGTTAGATDPKEMIGVVSVNVEPRNDMPSFKKGPDLTIAEDSGPQTVHHWATDIRPGPANEASQRFDFIVTTDNASLFASRLSIGADGSLRYSLVHNAHGRATVSVQLGDRGGAGQQRDRYFPDTDLYDRRRRGE